MKWYLILTNVIMPIYVSARISCRSTEGQEVDWFAAIKLPSSVDKWNGRGFVYFDSTQTTWKLSQIPINSTSSAIGATVMQLYSTNDKNEMKIAYNDDWPGTHHASGGRGHSKGVAVSNLQSGFWLVHSVPSFPPIGKYDYPESATKYAQSFFCFTFDLTALPAISHYMRYAQVTPFITKLPDSITLLAPFFEDVMNKRSLGRSDTKFVEVESIRSRGGLNIATFSKHKKFNKDLWHDLIAPTLKTSLAVETWRNGAAKNLGTQCDGPENVYDVTQVEVVNFTFNSTKDHSKWGVSMNATRPFVCIGDINRQLSQFKRGGGAVCIQNHALWTTFRKSVASFTDCITITKRK